MRRSTTKVTTPLAGLTLLLASACTGDGSPESRFEALHGAMEKKLRGPGVERLDPSSLARRVVWTADGARVEFDAGENVLGRHGLITYAEKNGTAGRQEADTVASSFVEKSPRETNDRRENSIVSKTGYGSKRSIEARLHAEVVATSLAKEKTEVREFFGPAIDMSSDTHDAGDTWRLLWWRRGGEELHWRLDGESITLRMRGQQAEEAPPQIRVSGTEGPAFAQSEDGRIAIVPVARFSTMLSGVRLTIRVQPRDDAPGVVRRPITLELAEAR